MNVAIKDIVDKIYEDNRYVDIDKEFVYILNGLLGKLDSAHRGLQLKPIKITDGKVELRPDHELTREYIQECLEGIELSSIMHRAILFHNSQRVRKKV